MGSLLRWMPCVNRSSPEKHCKRNREKLREGRTLSEQMTSTVDAIVARILQLGSDSTS